MLLVSFHGAKEGALGLNNLAAYSGDGDLLNAAVLPSDPAVVLSELRSIRPIPGGLLVVNANKKQSSILRYKGSGTTFVFDGIVFSQAASDGLVHPFDLVLDDTGNAYVSCQDTNLVLRFALPSAPGLGVPARRAPALPAGGTFPPGTFVASSVGTAVTPATPVPLPAGLAYAMKGDKLHSVRGLLWAGDRLYVADQPACRVKVYDRNGAFLGQSNEVDCPIHLTLRDGTLYVSGGDEIFSGPLATPPGKFTLTSLKGVHVKNSSGIVFTHTGKLYVASRTENTIYKFDEKLRPLPFHCTLPDNPEFLLHLRSPTDGH